MTAVNWWEKSKNESEEDEERIIKGILCDKPLDELQDFTDSESAANSSEEDIQDLSNSSNHG